jgi:pyruvate dehydrogenase kinase 2/3/4
MCLCYVLGCRYYNNIGPFECSADMVNYTDTFSKAIEVVKKRHDPVVTTMGKEKVYSVSCNR